MADRGGWVAPPEQPRRYRLRDRWSDYRRGRADARKSIPLVPSDQIQPNQAASENGDTGPQETVLEQLVTPYMDGLRNTRSELLFKVWERHQNECERLRAELRAAKTRSEPLAAAKKVAAARLDEVSKPLTDEEMTRRRLAEADLPEEVVRRRRERERAEARALAEEAHRKVDADLRVAEVALDHARSVFTGRLAAAQAVGWQIVHHVARREAAYVGALARKHKRGPELVRLLELTGPELPSWLLLEADNEEA
jgi:hypothetical protein